MLPLARLAIVRRAFDVRRGSSIGSGSRCRRQREAHRDAFAVEAVVDPDATSVQRHDAMAQRQPETDSVGATAESFEHAEDAGPEPRFDSRAVVGHPQQDFSVFVRFGRYDDVKWSLRAVLHRVAYKVVQQTAN